MQNDIPFGRKLISFGGAFRQALLVVVRGTATKNSGTATKNSGTMSKKIHIVETLTGF